MHLHLGSQPLEAQPWWYLYLVVCGHPHSRRHLSHVSLRFQLISGPKGKGNRQAQDVHEDEEEEEEEADDDDDAEKENRWGHGLPGVCRLVICKGCHFQAEASRVEQAHLVDADGAVLQPG